jgi:hypothetical protein
MAVVSASGTSLRLVALGESRLWLGYLPFPIFLPPPEAPGNFCEVIARQHEAAN